MNTPRLWTAEMHGYADGHKELHVCSGPDTLAVMRGEDEPGDGLSETVRADARLMAAAPDLLAACECAAAALNQHKTYPADCALAVTVLSAAITKAKGEKNG